MIGEKHHLLYLLIHIRPCLDKQIHMNVVLKKIVGVKVECWHHGRLRKTI